MSADLGEPRRRHRLRSSALIGLALALVAGGVVTATRVNSSQPPADSGTEVPTGTATVTRTDVVERQQVAGTLGYEGSWTVVGPPATTDTGGQSQSGILTDLPTVGAIIRRGDEIYEVDGRPVPLWYGSRPAWREFELGMTNGSDVQQLKANLVALGYDPGHAITVNRHFGQPTAAAVKRWQKAVGRPRTGTIPVGQALFLPGSCRVTAVAAQVGAGVQPGMTIMTGSTTRQAVTIALDTAFQQFVRRGNRVMVTLPDGKTTSGTVRKVSPVAVVAGAAGGMAGGEAQGGNDEGQGGSGSGTATVSVTVKLTRPKATRGLDQAPVQVAITTQESRGVLAVPTSALLAVPGGYVVELVAADGTRKRVPVIVGLFDSAAGLVEVAGAGLTEGTNVEVPAS